jgi:Uncharacterized conserved protein
LQTDHKGTGRMCNLYSNTTAQEAMRSLFDVSLELDRLGNAQPLPAIWPKYEAPVVRLDTEGRREMVMMHWGFLTPKTSAKTGKPLAPDAWNNARDDKRGSGLWRASFQSRRCLIPGSSFREAKGRAPATDFWFALAGEEERPPFAFAGLWRQGQPSVDGEAGQWVTHTMMTTEANDLVRPVHPTRMPVILAPEDYETWLTGTAEEAAALLRPYPAERMRIVREGIGMTSDPMS